MHVRGTPCKVFTPPATRATACMGRKRRLFSSIASLDAQDFDASPLSASLDEDYHGDRSLNLESVGNSDGRKFLTVWSTSYSYKTVTSYLTNTSVTVKVSAACTIPGQAFPLCNG